MQGNGKPIAGAAILALTAAYFVGTSSLAQAPASGAGVEKLCAIAFDKDVKYPARVEDSALPCLEQAAQKLKAGPGIKLVLVGLAHPVSDHLEAENHGMEREVEDTTGADIRFSDVAAYRAIDTKAYMTKWLGADATRVIPTTDYVTPGMTVTVYAVPGNADYWHNYINTTPINESKCTIKPCPNPIEDVLTPINRPQIAVARKKPAP